ncbi:MAG: peptidase MA family metallohydrolase [Gemmatimonadota bacterium]
MRPFWWSSGVLAVLACLLGAVAPLEGQEGFQTLTVRNPEGRPIVFHHAPADAGAALALSRIAAGFRPAPLAGALLPPDSIDVILAPGETAFGELTGGRVPDWGLAVAFPDLRRVVLRSPRLTGSEEVDPAIVLRHELGHVYLALAAGGSGAIPRWFNEGFAALYANEWRWVDPVRLAWGRVTGSLTPLSGLEETFPAQPAPSLAYVQSMAAVRNLERRGGERGVGLLLSRLRAGASFDAALRQTYGLTLGQFYAEWDREMGREFGWAVALTDERGLWIAAAVIVLLGWLVRRRALRREIERRKAGEDAALGPPEDHALGVEEWERYWEHDDEEWRDENELG